LKVTEEDQDVLFYKYKVAFLPHVVLIDQQGKYIRYNGHGPHDYIPKLTEMIGSYTYNDAFVQLEERRQRNGSAASGSEGSVAWGGSRPGSTDEFSQSDAGRGSSRGSQHGYTSRQNGRDQARRSQRGESIEYSRKSKPKIETDINGGGESRGSESLDSPTGPHPSSSPRETGASAKTHSSVRVTNESIDVLQKRFAGGGWGESNASREAGKKAKQEQNHGEEMKRRAIIAPTLAAESGSSHRDRLGSMTSLKSGG